MDYMQARKIVDSIHHLAEATGEEFVAVAARVVFMDKQREALVREAIDLHNKFVDASIPERGAMLGLHITEEPGGAVSCILSEREAQDADG